MAKSNIEISTIDDWNGLLFQINNDYAHWPDYIFRGQRQSDWLLEPTLTRALKNIKYKDKEELISEHLKRFNLEIRGRRGQNPKRLSDSELWALGQHYGLHTPLLDWTQSPYVALFFALTGIEKSKTGYSTLWALNSLDIHEINGWYSKKYKGKQKWIVELINPELDENERLVNQNGLFTKLNFLNDIETWVEKGPDLGWITLSRINISDKVKEEGISFLNLMNINYSTLFPDLFGSSMSSNRRLEQTGYILKKQEKANKEAEKHTTKK